MTTLKQKNVINFSVLEAVTLDLKEGHLPYQVSFFCLPCVQFSGLIDGNVTTIKSITNSTYPIGPLSGMLSMRTNLLWNGKFV